MKEIQLSLTMNEINAILGTLGQRPTSDGAWPLFCKVRDQAAAQMNEPPTESKPDAE